MKNAIILHGMPGKKEYYNPDIAAGGNYHWLPWLQKQLIIRDIKADNPFIPHSYAPTYENYKREFERFDITPETTLVGHSNGAGFLVRWLSENKDIVVDKVILVAPWIDPEGELESGFYKDLHIDSKLTDRANALLIFNSDDDFAQVQESVEIIRKEIPAIQYREFHKMGHFVIGDIGKEFPELLNEIIK